MQYTQLESSQAKAWLQSRINYRAAVSHSELTKPMNLSPGKQYALEWRIEAAYRAQVGRQRVSKFMINRLAERLPDDKVGLSEGLIFHTFEYANRPPKKTEQNHVQIDILPILWHLPGHLCNVLAAQILANPTFGTADLDAWLNQHSINRSQSLPDLKHMRMAPAKA